MKVVLYGKLAAALGGEVDVSLDSGCTVADLRRALAEAHPGVRDDLLSRTTRACVEDAIVLENHMLRASDQIELLPVVSGG
jgi:molybdopterin converting factor small subunit